MVGKTIYDYEKNSILFRPKKNRNTQRKHDGDYRHHAAAIGGLRVFFQGFEVRFGAMIGRHAVGFCPFYVFSNCLSYDFDATDARFGRLTDGSANRVTWVVADPDCLTVRHGRPHTVEPSVFHSCQFGCLVPRFSRCVAVASATCGYHN